MELRTHWAHSKLSVPAMVIWKEKPKAEELEPRSALLKLWELHSGPEKDTHWAQPMV
jgi:hypothetical protein